MRAPWPSSPFVCCACRLPAARTPVSLLSRAPLARLSTSTQRRDAFDDDRVQRRSPAASKWRNPRQPGRLRTRFGKLMREASEPLDVQTQGRQPEILVLRDVEVDEPAPEPKPEPEPEPASNVSGAFGAQGVQKQRASVLDAIKREQASLAESEIHKSIEGLRPSGITSPDRRPYLAAADFARLHRLLLDGFTHRQLLLYLEAVAGMRQKPADNEQASKDPRPEDGEVQGSEEEKRGAEQESQGSSKSQRKKAEQMVENSLKARTQWHAGTTPLDKRLSAATYEPDRPVPRRSTKEDLADRILRTAWRAMVLDEIEGLGELELVLRSGQLALLTAGPQSRLDRIASSRLVKIESCPRPDVIRITANLSSAEYAAGDVESCLATAQEDSFNLREWKPHMIASAVPDGKMAGLFSQADLKTIENVSGAVLRTNGRERLILRALSSEQIEHAHRLLLDMLPLTPIYASTWAGLAAAADRKMQSGSLYPSLFKSVLPYRHRNTDLGRWMLPARKPVDNRRRSGAVSNKDDASLSGIGKCAQKFKAQVVFSLREALARSTFTIAHPQDANEDAPKFKRPWQTDKNRSAFKHAWEVDENAVTKWTTEASVVLRAEFGHALFPIEGTNHTDPLQDEALSPPVFANINPSLPKVLMGMEDGSSLLDYACFEYHFTPSVPTPVCKHPALRVRLRFNAKGVIMLEGVFLEFNMKVRDVLLPGRAQDIRFYKSNMLTMENALQLPDVRRFLDAIEANVRSGERLTAPPDLTVQIPANTLREKAKTIRELRPVKYLFTRVEHQQEVVVRRDGASTAVLTGVQGGVLAAKCTRLQLEHQRLPSQPAQDVQAQALEHFVGEAFALVDRVSEAAVSNKPLDELRRDADRARQST